jgi:ribosomal protein S18 acetylase RimI-like enzyme
VRALLLEELVRRLKARGVPRIILMSASKNEAAQRLFAKHGWRPTMVEMTREVEEPGED